MLFQNVTVANKLFGHAGFGGSTYQRSSNSSSGV